MDITKHHLRVILAVADTGSISRAAQKLGTSQAALSAQLRRIEQALEADLFVRSRAGCTPTSLGQAVLAKAREVVGAGSVPVGGRLRVRLGGYSGFLQGELGRRLAGEPWVSGVRLYDNPDPKVSIGMVVDNDLDIALVYDWPPVALPLPERVRSRIIHPSEPVFVMMAREHPLARAHVVTLRALADYPWVDEPPGTTMWPSYLQHVCRQAGVSLDQRHYAVNLPAARRLVQTTNAIAPVRATTEARPSQVTIRDLEGHPLRQRLRLVYRPEGMVAAHASQIVQHIVQSYAEHQQCSAAFHAWWHSEGCYDMPVR